MKVAHLAAVLVVATGVIATAPAAALAGSQSQHLGTPAQQASCRPDVYRLCAEEIPTCARSSPVCGGTSRA
jgi:hypothetical protein